MKLKLLNISLIFFAFLLSFIFPKIVLAANYSLSGIVQDGTGAVIEGATINIYNSGTTTDVVTPTTTNQSGNYNFGIVPEGNYDVQINPPSGSGFSPAIALSQNIAKNTILNFTLIPSELGITFSGHIYEQSGVGLNGQQIIVDKNGPNEISVSTDEFGFYTLTVLPGSYSVEISGIYKESSYALRYEAADGSPNLNLGQSTILDIIPGFKDVALQVQDSTGQGIYDVSTSTGFGSPEYTFPSVNGGEFIVTSRAHVYPTDENGYRHMWLFPGNYQVEAVPPNGSPYVTTTLNIQVASDNATVPLTMLSPELVTYSGHVYDPDGVGLHGHLITVDRGGSNERNVSTDESGFYILTIPPGSYPLEISGLYYDNGNSTDYTLSYEASDGSPNINLQQSTTLDITLDFKEVTLHVQNSAGQGVYDVTTSTGFGSPDYAFPSGDGGQFLSISRATGFPTNEEGDRIMWLFPGDYQVEAVPPNNSPYVTTNLDIEVTGDNQTIPLIMSSPELVTYSGYLYGPNGDGLHGHLITVDRGGPNERNVSTDESGFYALTIPPGSYSLEIAGIYNESSYALSYEASDGSPNLNLEQNTGLNITLDLKQVMIHVQNLAGQGVYDVITSTGFGAPDYTFASNNGGQFIASSRAQGYPTNENGDRIMWLFPGNYQIEAVPAANSPLLPFVTQLSIISNQNEVIDLQYNHEAPVTTIDLQTEHQDGTYTNPTTVTLSATADTGYTIANTYYEVDGGSQQTYSGSFLVTGAGEHAIDYWSVDSSGVQELHNTRIFTIVVAPTPTDTPTLTPVPNVAPVVGSITATVNPIQVMTVTGATASFTDANVSDTHTALWDWGDGMTSPGNVTESNGSGSVDGSHVYLAAGVYEVTLTVTDNNNASGTEVYQYLSVYNPTPQGLFNGVRKFTTPAGSYTANPSLTGQVMFGVQAKYEGTTPTGDVSMDFNAAGFEFEATSIITLVIANGNKATLRGTGTVNGNSGYTFLVTGLDGGSGGDDFVRFQIKDALNNVVFDSQLGAGDTADPTALITAGNVVIH